MNTATAQVWPPLLTPFTTGGLIDFDALDALVDFYIESDVDGILVLGLSGEAYELDPAERIQVVKRVFRRVDGRTLVAVGLPTNDEVERAELVRISTDLGACANVLLASQLTGRDATDSEFAESLEKVVELLPGPLGIYEAPLPYKRTLGLRSLEVVADSGRFQFMKDACLNENLFPLRAVSLANSTPWLLNAEIYSVRASMEAGYTGFCGLVANLYPKLVARAGTLSDPEGETIAQLLSISDAAVEKIYPSSAKYILSSTIGRQFSSYSRRLKTEADPRSLTSLISFDNLVHDRFA